MSLLVSGLFLLGCAGSFEYKPRALSGAKWQAANVSVNVDDARQTASTKLPTVPKITLGGGREADLRLPPEFKEFVRWRLSQLLSGNGPRLRLIILPQRVRAGWRASAWSETELANVSLRFRIVSEDGQRVIVEGTGTSRKEFSSGDASDQELALIFRAACNDAFDDFFASAANLKRLNDAIAATDPSSGLVHSTPAVSAP